MNQEASYVNWAVTLLLVLLEETSELYKRTSNEHTEGDIKRISTPNASQTAIRVYRYGLHLWSGETWTIHFDEIPTEVPTVRERRQEEPGREVEKGRQSSENIPGGSGLWVWCLGTGARKGTDGETRFWEIGAHGSHSCNYLVCKGVSLKDIPGMLALWLYQATYTSLPWFSIWK